MYQITTRSGTVYSIENGRVTREGDAFIDCGNGFRPSHQAVVNEPFILLSKVAIGRRFKFLLKNGRVPFCTSPVAKIEKYCPTHDLFDCWLERPVGSITPVSTYA